MWASRFHARSPAAVGLLIRFLFIGSRLCSTLLSDPASRRSPCASLSLLLHQDGKRTFTSQLLNMLGTQEKRLPAATEGVCNQELVWLRGVDLNHRPLGYEGKSTHYTELLQPTNSNETLRNPARAVGYSWVVLAAVHGQNTDRAPKTECVANRPTGVIGWIKGESALTIRRWEKSCRSPSL